MVPTCMVIELNHININNLKKLIRYEESYFDRRGVATDSSHYSKGKGKSVEETQAMGAPRDHSTSK